MFGHDVWPMPWFVFLSPLAVQRAIGKLLVTVIKYWEVSVVPLCASSILLDLNGTQIRPGKFGQ